MGFKEIVFEQNASNGEVPWVKDFLASNTEMEGSIVPVDSVSFGNKGALIVTEFFKCFLFKSLKMHNFLFEALNVWVNEKKPVHCLVIKLDSATSLGFSVGIEDQVEASWNSPKLNIFVRNTGSPVLVSTQNETNPLLTTPSNSVTKQSRAKKQG